MAFLFKIFRGKALKLEYFVLKCENCKEEVFRSVMYFMENSFCHTIERWLRIMFLIYFILWVIFNGNFTLEIGIFGLAISGILLTFTCKFMDYSFAIELWVYKKSVLFLKYVCLLVKEIVKANMNVIHLILTQKEEIEPVLVHFHSDLKTDVGRAFLANCITLTPGTITVTLEDSDYTVHCLDKTMAEGLEESEFVEDIRNLEGSAKTQRRGG